MRRNERNLLPITLHQMIYTDTENGEKKRKIDGERENGKNETISETFWNTNREITANACWLLQNKREQVKQANKQNDYNKHRTLSDWK